MDQVKPPSSGASPGPLAPTRHGTAKPARDLKRRPVRREIHHHGDILVSRPQALARPPGEDQPPWLYNPALFEGVLHCTPRSSLGRFSVTAIAAHLATLIPSLALPIHEAVYINKNGTPFLSFSWDYMHAAGRDGWTVTVVAVDSDVFSKVFIPRNAVGNAMLDALRAAAAEALGKRSPEAAPPKALGN